MQELTFQRDFSRERFSKKADFGLSFGVVFALTCRYGWDSMELLQFLAIARELQAAERRVER